MIWLSRRKELERIILTLNINNLEFIGEYKFFVRDKKIIKLQGGEVPRFCLLLSTETGAYESILTVSRKKYDQAKIEELYGLCGVIRNTKQDDFILITEKTNPHIAIREVVWKSWASMIFIAIVFGLCLGTLVIFIYPILHLSWK